MTWGIGFTGMTIRRIWAVASPAARLINHNVPAANAKNLFLVLI
jgi:hypothetical protein